MSEAKFTPGTWVITDTCSNYIFNVVRIGSKDINCGTEANAHLIAAAPELYECLQWIRDNYPSRGPEGYPNLDWLAKTDAALAKARGETQ